MKDRQTEKERQRDGESDEERERESLMLERFRDQGVQIGRGREGDTWKGEAEGDDAEADDEHIKDVPRILYTYISNTATKTAISYQISQQ